MIVSLTYTCIVNKDNNVAVFCFLYRSVDVCLDNEVERIHAIKLIRKIAHVAPQKLSTSLIYPLVAIGNDGVHERDRMVRISLATICEIGKKNFIMFYLGKNMFTFIIYFLG